MTDLIPFNKEFILDPNGLPNMSGIHCYWNSTLQALLSCPQFVATITDLAEINQNNLIAAFHQFIKREINNMDLYKYYIRSLHAIGKPITQLTELASNQQCAGETFTYILELFEKVSDIARLFEHRYQQKLLCANCQHNSQKKITSILFEISPTQQLYKDLYQSIELIQDYKCEKCSIVNSITKSSRLTMLPELLVIMVKNYMWGEHGGIKQMQHTIFPEILHFKPLGYRAVAYIDHFGHLNSGHYTATCLRRGDHDELRWFNFNDSKVTPAEFAPNLATYLIFYSYDPAASSVNNLSDTTAAN